MARLLAHGFSISLDGYGAGPSQSLENPLGVGGEGLHDWLVHTRTFKRMHGGEGGDTGIDEDFAARGVAGIGPWIIGRNMFGPIRGPWPDESWRGWWGENPPYHTPVFVLTHHKRPPLEMKGGTVFHFVTEGIHAALERARAAAGRQDVRDRKSTRLNSSHGYISYAVFCLKKKKKTQETRQRRHRGHAPLHATS